MKNDKKPILFQHGKMGITLPCIYAMQKAKEYDNRFFIRHIRGDFGVVPERQKRKNERAIKNGCGRVISEYRLKSGVNFWIVTDINKLKTTVLLPVEYDEELLRLPPFDFNSVFQNDSDT